MLNPIKTRVWVRHYGREKWSKDRLQNLMDLHSHLLTIFANKTKSNNQILQNRYYFLPTPQSSDRWTVIGVKMLFTAIAAHSQGEMLEHSIAATDTSVVEEKRAWRAPECSGPNHQQSLLELAFQFGVINQEWQHDKGG